MANQKFQIDYSKRTPGEIVRIRREDLNWSQMELSMRIGRTVQQVNRIEKNTTNPTIDTVNRLEEVLQIPLFPAFIEFQKQKRNYKPTLSDIILMIIAKNDLSEEVLRNMFEDIILRYLEQKKK